MIENTSFDYDPEADEYYLILDGDRHGPIEKQSLADLGSDLHMHFSFFQNAPQYEEVDVPEDADGVPEEEEELSDEELDDMIEEAVEEVEDEMSEED